MNETLELSAGSIEYRDTGDGPTLLFLHGLLSNGSLWRDVVERLAPSHRCVVPDWPLGAHSRALRADADLSPYAVASLVAEFITKLDLRDVTLIANDTGGAIAQLVATQHPQSIARLVLTPSDAFDNFLPPMFRPLQYLARVPRLLGLAMQGLRWRPLRQLPLAFGWLTKHHAQAPVIDGWLRPVQSDRAIGRDVERFLRGIDPRITQSAARRLHEFTKPVLIVWAREDRVFPPDHARRLVELFPDARLRWVDDSYAFVPLDEPAKLAELIIEFEVNVWSTNS